MFSSELQFSFTTVKLFHLERFAIYGSHHINFHNKVINAVVFHQVNMVYAERQTVVLTEGWMDGFIYNL